MPEASGRVWSHLDATEKIVVKVNPYSTHAYREKSG